VTIGRYVRKLLLDLILNMQFYYYLNITAYMVCPESIEPYLISREPVA